MKHKLEWSLLTDRMGELLTRFVQVLGKQYRLARHVIALLLFSAVSAQAGAAGELHKIELVAEKLVNGYFAYRMKQYLVSDMSGANEQNITARYPDFATIPGPTIVINEGDEVDLTLIHQFNPEVPGEEQVSVHVHGVHYDILSDGTLKYLNMIKDESAVPAMVYEYKWRAAEGTAGTWPYHDHNMINHNGAEDKGLFGALIVNKKSGSVDISFQGQKRSVPLASVQKDYILYMFDDTFAGTEIDTATGQQTYLGANPSFNANRNDIVRFHVIALGTNLHTFKLAGYGWIDPGTNTVIGEKAIGPIEKHVFAVQANYSAVYMDTAFSSVLLGMQGNFNVQPE
ncbi:MAG: multicopper oxidase domain-containing protein [Nitrosomonas sp.]|nr:MAG: multicopper oxidase domain-containing protein [Nitrosomonas sp.]